MICVVHLIQDGIPVCEKPMKVDEGLLGTGDPALVTCPTCIATLEGGT